MNLMHIKVGYTVYIQEKQNMINNNKQVINSLLLT